MVYDPESHREMLALHSEIKETSDLVLHLHRELQLVPMYSQPAKEIIDRIHRLNQQIQTCKARLAYLETKQWGGKDLSYANHLACPQCVCQSQGYMDMPPEVRTHVLTCLQEKKAKDPDVRLYKQKQKMLDVQRRKIISKWQKYHPEEPITEVLLKGIEEDLADLHADLAVSKEKLKGNWDWKLKMTDILSRRSAEAFTTTRV